MILEKVSLSVDECFSDLIKRRAWYKDSGNDRTLAFKHKLSFLKGNLSYDKKVFYLEKAGYTMTQEEKWRKKN